jgi:hypothetical protein
MRWGQNRRVIVGCASSLNKQRVAFHEPNKQRIAVESVKQPRTRDCIHGGMQSSCRFSKRERERKRNQGG